MRVEVERVCLRAQLKSVLFNSCLLGVPHAFAAFQDLMLRTAHFVCCFASPVAALGAATLEQLSMDQMALKRHFDGSGARHRFLHQHDTVHHLHALHTAGERSLEGRGARMR